MWWWKCLPQVSCLFFPAEVLFREKWIIFFLSWNASIFLFAEFIVCRPNATLLLLSLCHNIHFRVQKLFYVAQVQHFSYEVYAIYIHFRLQKCSMVFRNKSVLTWLDLNIFIIYTVTMIVLSVCVCVCVFFLWVHVISCIFVINIFYQIQLRNYFILVFLKNITYIFIFVWKLYFPCWCLYTYM
jgi:hypothetical protein